MKRSRRPNSIRINSRIWSLGYDKTTNGGMFSTYKSNGKGEIILGTKWKDSKYRTNLLLHEVIEAILTDAQRRWKDGGGIGDESRMVFAFDHAYLSAFVDSLADSLRSVGVLKDGII